jgi:hypothetical protein
MMRTILKGKQCKALKDWKDSNATSPHNIHYDYLSSAIKVAMLTKLVKEQCGLCAYTMKPIILKNGNWQAHIEHILPRSKHTNKAKPTKKSKPTKEKSVSWGNLLACVPPHGVACDYGAIRKGAYDPDTMPFVYPTRGGVSAQFRFRENGEVEGLTPSAVAILDEKVLNLNHIDLVNDRKGKISGALRLKPSATSARRRAQELRKVDSNGNLEPYCEAVAQVLEAYAKRLANSAARVAGVKR